MTEVCFSSDSAAVVVYVHDAETLDALGGSICGSSFDCVDDNGDGTGEWYAVVGEPWDDSLSDADNDRAFYHWRERVERELSAANMTRGVDWREIG